MLARYQPMDLPRVLFHARNDGFMFGVSDVDDVVGRLEAGVILDKDHEPFDGSSRLWRSMWGKTYLGYLVDDVVSRYSDEELSSPAWDDEPAQEAS